MSVYVCHVFIPYQGYSPPIVVYRTETEAIEWVKKNGKGAEYVKRKLGVEYEW